MPSARRSCLASPPILVNGSTAIEGLSGSGKDALATAATGCGVIGAGALCGKMAIAAAARIKTATTPVAQIDTNAKLDALLSRHTRVAFAHPALNFHGTTQGIDHARKLDQHSIAGGLYDLAAMLPDFRIDQRPAVPLQLGKRALLIGAH